jgi:hypothetical protein
VTLDEARQNIGAGVVYKPYPGIAEDGDITGVNETYVLVLYVGDRRPKATRPEDLTLLGMSR